MTPRVVISPVTAALRVAKTYARWWDVDYLTLLGAAWEGAASAPPGYEMRAASTQIIDCARAQSVGGWGRPRAEPGRTRVRVLTVTSYGEAEPTDHRTGETKRDRLVGLWEDGSESRRAHPLRARVFLYLRAVEGMTCKEIGAVVGLSEAGVYRVLTKEWPGVAFTMSNRLYR